uniref:SHSP domain-containing protein n=1 Tax=Tetraodon nigroviridis TaxID=99883 RepID=H3BY19_TETNG
MMSFFSDEPFFSRGELLWPLHRRGNPSLKQGFSSQRATLVDSLLEELHQGPRPFSLPLMSALDRLTDGKEALKERPGAELQTAEHNGDLLVTLDARGYAPTDITVKLEGRSLAVVAMKQAGAEESQSCSSSSSRASFSSSASAQLGFARRIDLPAHLDLSGLSCSLMDDGQLRIHAPVAKQPMGEERQVPIRYRTSLEFPISKEKTEEEKD